MIQAGNYGILRKQKNIAEYQMHDLKSSPAQIVILNEATPVLLEFMEMEPELVVGGCRVVTKENEPRPLKQWMCVSPNNLNWGNAVAVATSHFGKIKVLHHRLTMDGTYTDKPKKNVVLRRKMSVSRILIVEATTHPSMGLGHLQDKIPICNCHLNYKTAREEGNKGIKDGLERFWNYVAECYRKYGYKLLYGDWNMSLLTVKEEMGKRGVHIDLCAWTPFVDKNTGEKKIDSCAMFLCGNCQEPPKLLFGIRDGGGSQLNHIINLFTDEHPELFRADEKSEGPEDAEEAAKPTEKVYDKNGLPVLN